MTTLLQKLGSAVKGVLTGFDRIVFKGSILPLMHEQGVTKFLRYKGILNKEYKDWMLGGTKEIVSAAEAYAKDCTDDSITPIRSSKLRKDEIARARQEERGIESGLIGIWSATEGCSTYKARFSSGHGFPQIRREWSKCKHLYFYFDHADYGFLNVRLQTWFPYHIQIAMNGREWLRRSLEKEGIGFQRHQNKFLDLDDFEQAQILLNQQLDSEWLNILDGFLPIVFPSMGHFIGENLSHYWTLWQSEWATDYIFTSRVAMQPIANQLVMQAFLTGTTSRVLRYFDKPLTKEGCPYRNMADAVESRLLDMNDGLRTRHWVGGNSVKIYTQENNLRIETTVNDPKVFKVHRHAQGEASDAPKRRLPLRKGVADIPLRAAVSDEINRRADEALAAMEDASPLLDVVGQVTVKKTKGGRRIRGLDLMGKDRAVISALSDPRFDISGMSNVDLRRMVSGQAGWRGLSVKQQSAKMSRMIRLLRDHGILHKCQRQKRYRLSSRGRKLAYGLSAALHASTKELTKVAA